MFDEIPQVALIGFAVLPGFEWAARLSNHDP